MRSWSPVTKGLMALEKEQDARARLYTGKDAWSQQEGNPLQNKESATSPIATLPTLGMQDFLPVGLWDGSPCRVSPNCITRTLSCPMEEGAMRHRKMESARELTHVCGGNGDRGPGRCPTRACTRRGPWQAQDPGQRREVESSAVVCVRMWACGVSRAAETLQP